MCLVCLTVIVGQYEFLMSAIRVVLYLYLKMCVEKLHH